MGTRNIIIASDLCSMGPELHARTLYTPACMPDNKGPVATGVPPESTRSSDRTGLSSNLCRLNDTLACLAKHTDIDRTVSLQRPVQVEDQFCEHALRWAYSSCSRSR
jgi:hypothetical protein